MPLRPQLVSDRAAPRPSTKLRALLARDDRVLAVLGAPNAFHATIMEAAGCEAAFVGTGITGGNYTALPDAGLLSATTIGVIVGRYLLQLDGLKDADPKEITDLLRPSFHSLVDHGVEPKKTRAPRSKRRRAG